MHSITERNVESVTASGRFTAGMHGLLAQLEREKIIENVKLGIQQAARAGQWLNHAAHLVRRAFTLRAAGHSYPEIERGVGLKYSAVRHLLENGFS